MGSDAPSGWIAPSNQSLLLLQALQLPGVGIAAVRKLASGAAAQGEAWLREFLDRPEHRRAQDFGQARVKKIVERCRSHSIVMLSVLDEAYPPNLRSIIDQPPILYIRGSLASLLTTGCAVVGTRQASEAGKQLAAKIAGILASRHLSTISGLALGIDTAAHMGALDSGGATVAVLAHGLDLVAPTSNRDLAARIVSSGGALVSEHEPGVPPRPAEFVRRNRIQSGMSVCSIVVESGERGGSIHQARFTRQQGRPLFAVLPELNGSSAALFNAAGGRLLVRELGAIPLRTADDLRRYLDSLVIPTGSSDPEDGVAQLKLSL